MRFFLLLALVLCASPLCAQPTGRPLEVLREEAERRVQSMSVRFEEALKAALQVFRAPEIARNPENDRTAREALEPWAGTFSAQILGAFDEAKSGHVRANLLAVLSAEGGPTIAEALLNRALAAESDEAAHALLSSFRTLKKPGQKALLRIEDSLTGAFAARTHLAAEALTVLAIHAHPNAAALARARTTDASEFIRRSAIWALGERSDDRRHDAKLIAAATTDAIETIRTTALQALKKFPDAIEGQRAVVTALEVEQSAPVLLAAIDCVGTIGRKDSARRPLLAIVTNEEQPAEVRESAAKQLYAFGDPNGVKLLVKPLEKLAAERSRNFDAQFRVGEEYQRLGAYEEALEAYDKAKPRAKDRDYELFLPAARCLARLGRFPAAAKLLVSAGYREDWSRFADDADFATMRADERYAQNFQPR